MDYRTGGTSAYARSRAGESTARPLPQPQRLPRQPRRPAPAHRSKTKLAVPLFAVAGGSVAFVLLFLVIFSYMRLYEAKSAVSDQRSQQVALQAEQERLQAEFECALDLDAVEARARQLGMREPLASQIRYVQVEMEDSTLVYTQTQRESMLSKVLGAFGSVFADLVEYFF